MKRRIARGTVTVTVAGVLAAVVVGFYFVSLFIPSGRISAAELAGTWRGDDGFSVTFQRNGNFCAKRFPMNTAGSDRVSSCGTWRIQEPPRPGDQGVHLDFTELRHSGAATLLAASGKELYIDWFPDDTSTGFSLERVAD